MKGLWLGAVLLVVSTTAAAETKTTYSYDPLGRLVTSRVETDGAATTTSISYDPAGNRDRYQVSGAANADGDTGAGAAVPPGTRRFVVVPLNGFTIIPIR